MTTTHRPDVIARFWLKVDKTTTPDGCWLWKEGITAGGYPQFWTGTHNVGGHRLAYELEIGEIQPGMTIDHVLARGCTNRHCVNPAHLEQVTNKENLRRSSASKHQFKKTHCPSGHPYFGDNLRIQRRGGENKARVCRTCSKRHRRAYDQRAKDAKLCS